MIYIPINAIKFIKPVISIQRIDNFFKEKLFKYLTPLYPKIEYVRHVLGYARK